MPELPEVETVRRTLAPAVVGRTVLAVHFVPLGERVLQGVPVDAFCRALVGRRIDAVRRRGKYLILALDDGRSFVVHLRMTGRFEVATPAAVTGQFLRATIVLDDATELRWRDVRRFGTWEVREDCTALDGRLGPEPLDERFEAATLAAALAGRRAPVKAVLLDQRRIAGLGNIYVDESLHEAGIHPSRTGSSLDFPELQRLHRAIRLVLERGIANCGTTLRDFANAYGEEGRNREHLQVYGRSGAPCFRCGTEIERSVVAGRGTHACPHCQPITLRAAVGSVAE